LIFNLNNFLKNGEITISTNFLTRVLTKAFTFILISTLLTFLIVTIHASDALSLDTSFNGDGRVTTSFSAADDLCSGIALQYDNKIVVVGTSDDGSGTSDFAVARYLQDLSFSFPGTGGGGGCFIATAAYGSPKIGFVPTMALMLLFGSGFMGFVSFRRKYKE
jgi:hypothetical protein